MESSDDPLRWETRDRVAYLTINRPERLNALNLGLSRDLIAAFDRVALAEDIWAVVLTGSGERAFCAGLDLKEAGGDDSSALPNTASVVRNLFETIVACEKPVIAAVNGWALGAGFELALACDLRVAAEHASVGMPEAKRGMGGTFGAQMLARTLPSAIAFELLYLGEPISSQRALSLGLVNVVVGAADLHAATEELAGRIVANAPLTLRHYKATLSRGRDLPLSQALRLDVGPNPYISEDRLEGIAAFIEKRSPNWKAR